MRHGFGGILKYLSVWRLLIAVAFSVSMGSDVSGKLASVASGKDEGDMPDVMVNGPTTWGSVQKLIAKRLTWMPASGGSHILNRHRTNVIA